MFENYRANVLKNCWKLMVNVMELMVSKCIEGNCTKFTTQKYLNFSSF